MRRVCRGNKDNWGGPGRSAGRFVNGEAAQGQHVGVGTRPQSRAQAPDRTAGHPAAPSPGGEVESTDDKPELVIFSPGLSGDPGRPGAPGSWHFPHCGASWNSGASLAEGALWPESPQQISPFPGGDTAPRSPVGGFDENVGSCKAGQLCRTVQNAYFSLWTRLVGSGVNHREQVTGSPSVETPAPEAACAGQETERETGQRHSRVRRSNKQKGDTIGLSSDWQDSSRAGLDMRWGLVGPCRRLLPRQLCPPERPHGRR